MRRPFQLIWESAPITELCTCHRRNSSISRGYAVIVEAGVGTACPRTSSTSVPDLGQQEHMLGRPERTTSYEVLIIALNSDATCEKSIPRIGFGILG